MKKFKFNSIEAVLASLALISIIGLCFYFYSVTNPNQTPKNPFDAYDTNPGIVTISLASLFARTTFIICFFLLALEKTRQNKVVLGIYILAAVSIAFLQWFELYYGSTFYYGEVRDKQGLSYPLFASFMVTLAIWKINYSRAENRNREIKLAATAVLNAGLYVLWTLVYDSWKLWQS